MNLVVDSGLTLSNTNRAIEIQDTAGNARIRSTAPMPTTGAQTAPQAAPAASYKLSAPAIAIVSTIVLLMIAVIFLLLKNL